MRYLPRSNRPRSPRQSYCTAVGPGLFPLCSCQVSCYAHATVRYECIRTPASRLHDKLPSRVAWCGVLFLLCTKQAWAISLETDGCIEYGARRGGGAWGNLGLLAIVSLGDAFICARPPPPPHACTCPSLAGEPNGHLLHYSLSAKE